MKNNLTLLNFADNNKKLIIEIRKRLKRIDKSMNDLCRYTGVQVSTIWRWANGSKPNVATIGKLERQLVRWERII